MTCWGKIKILEESINKDSGGEILKEFIDALSKEKLLNEFMLSALCYTTVNKDISNKMWSLLHEFAERRIKSP